MRLSSHSHIRDSPTNSNSVDSQTVETPIKKSRADLHCELKTAETPNMGSSCSKVSIADLEAEELFDNFSRVVTISESNEQYEQTSPYRKLRFDQENTRLDFDQSTNSMKKKRRGSRLILSEEGQCMVIKPFALNQCSEVATAASKMLLMSNTNSNLESSESHNQDQMSPPIRRRYSKSGIMSTPTKKPVRSAADLEMAAKKECPYRDLDPKRMLFG